MDEQSYKWHLNKADMISVGKGLLIAVGGAALTYITEVIGKIDFGQWTPIVVAAAAIIINLGRKWFEGPKAPTSPIKPMVVKA